MLLISLHTLLSLLNLALLLGYSLLKIVDVALNMLNTSLESGNLVLKVLHLKRKFATQRTFLVDSRESSLKLIESLQFALY